MIINSLSCPSPLSALSVPTPVKSITAEKPVPLRGHGGSGWPQSPAEQPPSLPEQPDAVHTVAGTLPLGAAALTELCRKSRDSCR